MKLSPASTKASSNRNEVGSSAVQPNTFPPRASGAISILDFPSLRFFICCILPVFWPRYSITLLCRSFKFDEHDLPHGSDACRPAPRPRGGRRVKQHLLEPLQSMHEAAEDSRG